MGVVKAAIWRNETDNGTRFNVTFSCIYRDSENDWKSTSSFGRDDLLLLGKVPNQAHSRILRCNAKKTRTSTSRQPRADSPLQGSGRDPRPFFVEHGHCKNDGFRYSPQ